jgi:hypothetical protein
MVGGGGGGGGGGGSCLLPCPPEEGSLFVNDTKVGSEGTCREQSFCDKLIHKEDSKVINEVFVAIEVFPTN